MLKGGNGGVRVQPKFTMREHAGRKVSHDGLHLNVKVAEHFVTVPSAEEADDIRIDLGAKERRSPRSS